MTTENPTFENLENNKNKGKKSIGIIILNVFLVLYIVSLTIYFIFSILFIKAQVIGCSMQPLYNKNLSYTDDSSTSIYQDVVYANRYEKGSNGDIVLVKLSKNDVVIKRIIAVGGQKITLRKESDGYYHYYLSNNKNEIGNLIKENYVDDKYKTSMNYDYYCEFLLIDGVIENSMFIGGEASYIIPKGKIFILGDNREVSVDSHCYGAVNQDCVIGKVYFSHKYNESFFDVIWQKVCSIF